MGVPETLSSAMMASSVTRNSLWRTISNVKGSMSPVAIAPLSRPRDNDVLLHVAGRRLVGLHNDGRNRSPDDRRPGHFVAGGQALEIVAARLTDPAKKRGHGFHISRCRIGTSNRLLTQLRLAQTSDAADVKGHHFHSCLAVP